MLDTTSLPETPKPELAIYSGMNQIFECTQKYIDTMQDGDKITMSELTDKVAAVVKMPHTRVLNLVSMFLQKNKEVKIETGRGGGVFKGKKKSRIDQRPRCHECGQVVRPKSTFNTIPSFAPSPISTT